jgi:hypothetical protein
MWSTLNTKESNHNALRALLITYHNAFFAFFGHAAKYTHDAMWL